MNEPNKPNVEAYLGDLTQEQIHAYTRAKKARKSASYNAALKTAFKTVLESDYITVDGTVLTVAEKVALKTTNDVLKKDVTTVDDALGLEKLSGEYQEKQEVTLNGYEGTMKKLMTGKEY